MPRRWADLQDSCETIEEVTKGCGVNAPAACRGIQDPFPRVRQCGCEIVDRRA